MAAFTLVATYGNGTFDHVKGITDLKIGRDGDDIRLYSISNGPHAGLSSFQIGPGGAPVQIGKAALPTGTGLNIPNRIDLIEATSGPMVLTLGRSNQAVLGFDITDSGGFKAPAQMAPGSVLTSSLSECILIDTSSGPRLYAGLPETPGLVELSLASGSLVPEASIPDASGLYAQDVSALASARIEGKDFVFSACIAKNGVTAFQVGADGGLEATGSIGADQDLGINAPTALSAVQMLGETYVLLAASGTSTLTVLQVGSDGSLTATDQIADSLETRFKGVSALETVVMGPRVFVVAGGADDGLTLFSLLPGGQLLYLDKIVDNAAMTLDNIAALAATAVAGKIQIYVSDTPGAGLTQIAVDPGPLGLTVQGGLGADQLTGTATNDLLSGSAGADQLNGSAGDDILVDGVGRDTLTGGLGADIFMLQPDGDPDVITDFEIGVDRLDLSLFPMLYSPDQLDAVTTSDGIRLTFRDDVLEVRSNTFDPLQINDVFPRLFFPVSRSIWDPEVLAAYSPEPGPSSAPTSPPGNQIIGTSDNDALSGLNGAEYIMGGPGADTISGEGGSDTISGGQHADVLYGGDGGDVITGGPDNAADTIYGDAGADQIGGGDGNDLLFGGAQADIISGGDGLDTVDGDQGNDTLAGGSGHDLVLGGDGEDVLIGGLGRDTLAGGSGDDRLNGNGSLDDLFGETGNDVLAGGLGRDTVDGGAGNDTLRGNDGNDSLSGGGGSDDLFGDTGNDLMAGGNGNDLLIGGVGNDTLLGQTGNDVLNSGGGDDTVTGGSGNDQFVFVGGFGSDVITDFEEGVDTVVLGGFTAADLSTSAAGNDLVLQVTGGGNITVVNGVTDGFDVGVDVFFA